MFRPTNPNDRHQTDMEYQEWQRQRDKKKDDFPVIALNKSELYLLRQCDEDIVLQTSKNHNDSIRLRDLDLIQIMRPNDPSKNQNEYCFIRERGRNYLRYIDDKKAAEQRANRHDWGIAIFSSLVGAILSDPLWSLIRWIASHFQE